jgi:hypothetical protein
MLHKEEQGCDKECCPSQFFKLFLDFVFCFNWAPCIFTLPLFVVMIGPHLLFFNLLCRCCIVHFFYCTRMWKTSPWNIFLFSTFIFCFKWTPCQVALPFCVFLLSFCLLLFVHHGGYGCALCWCSSLCCATRNNKGARNIMQPNFLAYLIEHMNIKPKYINCSLWSLESCCCPPSCYGDM